MEKVLSGKIILITGGTSRLGEAFVRKALHENAVVYFTYFSNKHKADQLIEAGAKGFEVDLGAIMSIDAFVRDVKGDIKSIDVLIHNAAAVRDNLIRDMSDEDWDIVLNVDLKAPYYLTKKLLRLLLKKPGSKVWMITSRVALTGGYGTSNYAAAKAGLIALTRSLASEIGRRRVLVNALNPGFMKSKMTEGMSQAVIDQNLAASPLGEYSDPEEVADFLIYLCSDQMKQVTGQLFHFEARKIS
ncbi:MAG: SDR family oxidoreductase [Candidatus Omnitrophota bacterium]|nr:SDR family oxidoreductase [Candidatus Omnitrophota bacterium]